jgi:hypothetical protein
MAVGDGRTTRERLCDELAAAQAACDDPEVRWNIKAVDGMPAQLSPTSLIECPDRGVVRLLEQVAVHRCQGWRRKKGTGSRLDDYASGPLNFASVAVFSPF